MWTRSTRREGAGGSSRRSRAKPRCFTVHACFTDTSAQTQGRLRKAATGGESDCTSQIVFASAGPRLRQRLRQERAIIVNVSRKAGPLHQDQAGRTMEEHIAHTLAIVIVAFAFIGEWISNWQKWGRGHSAPDHRAQSKTIYLPPKGPRHHRLGKGFSSLFAKIARERKRRRAITRWRWIKKEATR
jgi:hypothetical protein